MTNIELRQRRQALGLTLRALAKQAEVSWRALQNWEASPERSYARQMSAPVQHHLDHILNRLEGKHHAST